MELTEACYGLGLWMVPTAGTYDAAQGEGEPCAVVV